MRGAAWLLMVAGFCAEGLIGQQAPSEPGSLGVVVREYGSAEALRWLDVVARPTSGPKGSFRPSGSRFGRQAIFEGLPTGRPWVVGVACRWFVPLSHRVRVAPRSFVSQTLHLVPRARWTTRPLQRGVFQARHLRPLDAGPEAPEARFTVTPLWSRIPAIVSVSPVPVALIDADLHGFAQLDVALWFEVHALDAEGRPLGPAALRDCRLRLGVPLGCGVPARTELHARVLDPWKRERLATGVAARHGPKLCGEAARASALVHHPAGLLVLGRE